MREMDNVNRSGHKANKHTEVWAKNALMNGQNFEVMILKKNFKYVKQ